MSAGAITPPGAGIVGCGVISEVYCRNLGGRDDMNLVACAGRNPERVAGLASAHGLEAMDIPGLLADPRISMILNLTPPRAHASISLAALEAGKHVYSEKPLATTSNDAKDVLALASRNGLRVGCAPDTILGPTWRAVLRAVHTGQIGRPFSASASMQYPGPEAVHPNPGFYYEPGGGPLFDSGPYYLTAIIEVLGPVRRVSATAQTVSLQRPVASGVRAGEVIDVRTPTHVSAILDFHDGATATITTSFDVWKSSQPGLEIHGANGSITLPDTNLFEGPALMSTRSHPDPTKIAGVASETRDHRGLGVIDMVEAIGEGRPHRASGEMALHVVEIIEAAMESAMTARSVTLGGAGVTAHGTGPARGPS